MLQVARTALLLLALGDLYGVFIWRTGLAVPCPFRCMTGYLCPGCGVTHMCMALLHLDFQAAYASHPMLFVLLPVLFLIFGKYILDYIKTGSWSMNGLQTGMLYVCIGLLLVFNVIRNLI